MIKNSVINTINNFINMMVLLLITSIVSKNISVELFGQYQFIIFVVNLLIFTTLPGLSSASSQSVARGFYGTYINNRLTSFRYSFIGSLMLVVIALYFKYIGNDNLLFKLFIIIAILFPFAYGLKSWNSFYNGKGNFVLTSVILVITNTISMIFLFLMSRYQNISIEIILFLTFGLISLINIVFYFITAKIENKYIENESSQYGIKISFYSLFNDVANYFDKFLILKFLSFESLAIYAIAEKFPEAIKSLIQSFMVVLVPKFAKEATINRRTHKFMILLSTVTIILTLIVAYFILGKLILYFFGEKYIESILLSQVLMVTIAISVYSTIRFKFIQSKLDSISYRNIQIKISLMRIITALLFIPFFKMWGAVLSVLIYRSYMHFVVSKEIKKYYTKE